MKVALTEINDTRVVNLPSPDSAIKMSLLRIIKLLGVITDPTDIDYCADYIFKNYKQYTPNELFEAFELAIAGKLRNEKNEIIETNLYGKVLNPKFIASILTPYYHYKFLKLSKQIALSADQHLNESKYLKEVERKNRIARDMFKTELIEKFGNDDVSETLSNLSIVPIYKILEGAKLTPDKLTRKAYYERAKVALKTELAATPAADAVDRQSIRKALDDIANDNNNNSRAIVKAKRMIVIDVLENKIKTIKKSAFVDAIKDV